MTDAGVKEEPRAGWEIEPWLRDTEHPGVDVMVCFYLSPSAMTAFTLTANLQAHAAIVLRTKTSRTHKTQVTLCNQWVSIQKWGQTESF